MAKGWNRTRPCPTCGGTGGAYDKRHRCRGFERDDGTGYYCERDNGSTPIKPLGVPIYLYKTDKEWK